ncbi:unnamed protein product [Schistosoma rodhaini]|uniref:FZ domain-containing protein n=1 Tax=Schistosoma rodhaini TaxID=6188 RepID=A0AA85GD51_9TREM|nr:unnamed protein product [Schistosoma rodhaini]
MLIILLLHSLCFKLIYTSPTSTSTTYGQQRCMKPVPIQIPECQNTFYNYTGMPNLIGQETQFDARHQLQTFKPLITYKCSSKLNFFLCSIYTPMCDVNTHYLIGPCRPLCEHVRARCAPVLRVFDFNWPENLNCSQFPLKNSVGGAMCMEGPEDLEEDINSSKSAIISSISSSSSDSNNINNLELKDKVNKPNHKDLSLDPSVKQMLQVITLDNDKIPNNQMKQVPIKGTKDNDDDNDEEQLELNQIMEKLTGEFLTTKPFLPNTLITSHFNKYPLSLPQLAQSIRYCSHFKKSIFYIYINRTGRCAPLCDSNILYTTEAKQLSIMWTSILACICSLMTIYTLIRYVMNLSHFRFNEKPIIYIALCQLFYALGFGLSLILGRTNITCGQDLDSGQRIRLQEGLDNGLCVFIFIIQYFFSIASYIWWTMLVIHWSLQRISMITSYINSYCCNTHSPKLRNTCSHDNKQFNNEDEINTESNCYCLPINSFCFCTENSFNWNQSEIIMNERLMQPSTKKHQTTTTNNNNNNNNNNPNNPTVNTIPINVQQKQYQPNFQNTLNHTITNGIKRDNSSWSTTINHNNHDYCQQQKYSMVFTSKSDQVSACLAREHVVAWLTAGLFTVGVLVSRQVDADELIPVCGVGRQNTNVLGAFILGPQTVLITLGSIAFTIGFLCLLPCFRKCKCFYWSQCNTNGNQSSRHHSVQSKKQNYNQGIDNQLIDGNPTFTRSTVNRSHHHHHHHHRHHHYQPTSHNIHQPHHHPYNHQSLRNHSSQRFNQKYPQDLCYTTSMSSSSSSSCDPMEFRIGLFCFLYLIPLICMNACDLYEYLYRDKWLTVPGYKQRVDDHSTSVNTNNHSNNNNNHKLINNQYPNNYGTRNHPEIMNFASYLWNINEVYGPNPELFMLRIFMSLVTGFTCSLWMWTVKGCCQCCSYFNYNCCLSVTNNIETLKQKQWENQNLPRNSKIFELTKQNYLCSNEFIKNNDNNGNKYNYKSKFTRTPDGTTYTLHPYAIYQHTKTPDNYHSQQLGINGQFDHRFPIIGCYSSTSLTNTTNNPDKNPSNIPSLLTKGHLSQLDTNFVGRDLEHSTSTTPGYYSHAKISPNMIIDSMSEDASASSIPPPLPPSNNRPSRLPARGDPCVGASSSQVFGLNNKMNTDNLDNHITNSTMNNNNNTDNSETENYSLIQFQITS